MGVVSVSSWKIFQNWSAFGPFLTHGGQCLGFASPCVVAGATYDEKMDTCSFVESCDCYLPGTVRCVPVYPCVSLCTRLSAHS